MKGAYLQFLRSAEKETTKDKSTWVVNVSSAQIQGKRETQEDRFGTREFAGDWKLLYVADGHGGRACVDFVVHLLPQVMAEMLASLPSRSEKNVKKGLSDVVEIINNRWAEKVLGKAERRMVAKPEDQKKAFAHVDLAEFQKKEYDSGTTLLLALLDLQMGAMYLCHLGDSRAVVKTDGPNTTVLATQDHGVPRRIVVSEKMEAKIIDGRVEGDLAMSAAIGDYTPALIGVIKTIPDQTKITLSRTQKMHLIMASDGLFEIIDQHQLFLNEHTTAREIIDERGESNFEDNTTIIYAQIHPTRST
jgi:serine/threonine protein phosphatase PrpC